MKLIIKSFRDMKQSAGQFLAFVLVIAAGAFFYTGLVTLSGNLSTYTKNYFHEHNLSDLHVYYTQISKEELADLSRVEGINKMEGRYTIDATEAFEGYKASLKIHSIPRNNEINTLAVTEGSIPSKEKEIVLDSRYAKEHGYGVGDSIVIAVQDKEWRLTVSGLGENVEHVKKNETQDHKAYGFGYIAEETIPALAGGFFYNELLIDVKDGYDAAQIGASIQEGSKELAYLSQITKERTFGYSQLQATIYNNNMMSKVIPLVLFVIESIILFLAMSRIIDSQRNQVGIMKALGVQNKNIMLHYMGYPVLVGIVGSILGFVISAFVFVPFVAVSNARAYSLPGIQFPLAYSSILPPIIVSSLFGMLSCYLSGRPILKESAAQAIRPKPPKSVKRILIERIPGIWNRLPYSYKLICRNLFLNKQKALASSVGVMVSTVLLITAFGTQASLQKVADQIEQVNTYDVRVNYKTGANVNTARLPEGLKKSYTLAALPVELIKDNQTEKAALVVTDEGNSLLHFFDKKGSTVSLEDSGVLVPQSYADQYQISEGDVIQFMFTAPELRNKKVDMKVQRITAQYSDPSFYITPDYLESLGLDYHPTSLLAEVDPTADLASIRSSFEQDPNVDSIVDQTDLKKSAEYMMKQNSFIFIMFIICSVILSLGAIYTITSINIYERNRELATLKVLGYQKHKINRLIFFENMFITTLAMLAALPVSGYAYRLVVKALSSTHQQIPDQLSVSVLIVSVLIAYLLTILANLLLRRKVNQINMIESLKSIE
jgi:putative ABC transport system permease protein